MQSKQILKWTTTCAMIALLAGCGGNGLFGRNKTPEAETGGPQVSGGPQTEERSTIWDLFNDDNDPNVTLSVNKYLWNASLDVLNFMPIQAADPFTGTIAMGYGRPQGASRAYRATVYITDPALDARSLRVSLQGAGGRAVSTETARAIEDAILSRARQLRIADGRL